MVRTRKCLSGAVLLLVTVAGACGNSGGDTTPTTTAPPETTTTTTTLPDLRHEFVALDGVPGVTDTQIRFAVIGIRSNNPLGTCILDCYLDGIRSYFEYRNAEGGLFGRELVVHEELDDELLQNQVRALEVIAGEDSFAAFSATLVASGWGDLDEAAIPTYVWNIHAAESANRFNIFGHIPAMCADCTQRHVPYLAKISGATKVASLGYGISENSKVCAQSVADSIDRYSADIGAEMGYFNDDMDYGLPNGIAPEVTAMMEAGVDFVSTCMDLNGMKTMALEMKRQGMEAVLYHPNTYNHPFVAEAGDLFDGDYVAPQFEPFEADSGNESAAAFQAQMEAEGRELSELSMIGWINAHTAFEALLGVGPEFDRASVVAEMNGRTAWDAGGLIVPIDWTRQHVPTTPDDQSNGYLLECAATLRMSGGAMETVADPATPWICWDNADQAWSEPQQVSFGG